MSEQVINIREQKIEQFRQLNVEAFDAARQQLVDALPDEFKAFYQLPSEELTYEQRALLPSILDGLVPNLTAIARASEDDNIRLASVNLIDEITDLNERIIKTNGYRTQINYPYWESLAFAEQEEQTVEARRLIYEAEKANAAAELEESIRLYEQAFAIWEKIFDKYPLLTLDDTAEDLFASIRRYMVITDSDEIPEDFPLIEFALMMGDLGRIDSVDYQRIRDEAFRKAKEEKLQSEQGPVIEEPEQEAGSETAIDAPAASEESGEATAAESESE